MTRHRAARSPGVGGFSALELVGVISVIAVVAACIFAWGNTAYQRGRQASCQSNLKQIGLALQLYAGDYGGRLPPSTDGLLVLDTYMKNRQILICPADAHPRSVGQRGASYGTSYFTVVGVATDDPPATVIAGDTAPRHRGRWNAVHLDGRVDLLPAAELPPSTPEGETQDAK